MRIVSSMYDATLFQQTYLSYMAAEDVNHDHKIESYLRILCEAMGVKFK